MRRRGKTVLILLGGTLILAGAAFWLGSRAPLPGKMIKVKVKGVAVDPVSGNPVVFLVEPSGEQFLPIAIGVAEARSILSAIKGIDPRRPMTHDLTARMLAHLGGIIRSAVVIDLQEDTYIAQLRVAQGRDMFYLDSRPSDAIALALRAGAPVYVSELLFREKSIEISPEAYPEMIPGDVSGLLGIRLQVMSPDLARHFSVDAGAGLLVSWVDPDGVAGRAGIEPGDILVKAEGDKLTSLPDLMKIMQLSEGEITLEILREGDQLHKRLHW